MNKERQRYYLIFMSQIMPIIYDSDANPQVVYPLLEQNLDKLTDEFAQVLQDWAVENLPRTASREAKYQAWSLHNLANLLMDFPRGNRASNIEIVIAGCESALLVYTKITSPTNWAAVQLSLGRAYRSRIRGNLSENVERAIAIYHKALEVYTKQAFPNEWGNVQNNLAVAYANKFSIEKEQAISQQKKALVDDILSKRTSQAIVARVTGLFNKDLAENLKCAIACFENVLEVHTLNTFPTGWAMVQYNLGRAYDDLRQVGQNYEHRAENCEKAIECYEKALEVYTPEANSIWWGNCHYNLGIAYNERTQGDPAENQEKAINHYQDALRVRTYDDYPQDWAVTQMNLGNAYLDNIFGERKENIEMAIKCYQEALKVYNPETLPEDWARLKNNLGLAYRNRTSGDKEENLQLAIACFEEALTVRTSSNMPELWAMTQNNLAATYLETENIQQAIALCQEVLDSGIRENYPQESAMSQYQLGVFYKKQQRITEAIQLFQSALEIFTPAAFPKLCRGVGSALGDTAFNTKQWSTAIDGYSRAIEALENTRGWATKESRRVEILRSDIPLYQRIVQAYINNGQLEKAFEYAERSRGKRLVDLMATNLYQDGNIPLDIKKLNDQYEAKQWEIDNIYNQNRKQMEIGSNSSTQAAIATNNPEDIERLETEKQQIWEQLRKSDFVLAAQKQVSIPNFKEMKQLVDNSKTALLSFYTTSDNTYIFILRENGIQLHICTGEGIENLQAWIVENWLSVYENDNSIWENNISDFLKELAQRLQLTKVINEHLQGIEEIILVPHIYLHLMPFAALPIAENEYLGDKFLIRYTPSCQVLDFCKKRPSIETAVKYGTVEDATDDLPCASFECEEIARLYDIPEQLRLKGSSQATKENYRQLVKQEKVQVLHSSHHASSNLEQPLESILLLANGEKLTLGELLTPAWRVPDLLEVFLSCCETNLGNPDITDDILTIGFGFLCAGARNVVSTLWSVEELATAIFCIIYYQRRKQGMSRPLALQKAQQELRNLTGKNFELRYKESLTKMLGEKLPQAKDNLKKAENKLNDYPENSPECLAWEQEWAKRYDIVKKIENAKNRLTPLCSEEYPFSHLIYWAGFTCSGLRVMG